MTNLWFWIVDFFHWRYCKKELWNLTVRLFYLVTAIFYFKWSAYIFCRTQKTILIHFIIVCILSFHDVKRELWNLAVNHFDSNVNPTSTIFVTASIFSKTKHALIMRKKMLDCITIVFLMRFPQLKKLKENIINKIWFFAILNRILT